MLEIFRQVSLRARTTVHASLCLTNTNVFAMMVIKEETVK